MPGPIGSGVTGNDASCARAGETRTAIANHLLVEVVRSTNRDFVRDEEVVHEGDAEIFSKIAVGREKITREILKAAAERVKDLGIELLDLRFKRLNYVQEVREKVYDRMITERKRIADKYRSEGQGEASKILGEKERELKRITSEAFKRSHNLQFEFNYFSYRTNSCSNFPLWTYTTMAEKYRVGMARNG